MLASTAFQEDAHSLDQLGAISGSIAAVTMLVVAFGRGWSGYLFGFLVWALTLGLGLGVAATMAWMMGSSDATTATAVGTGGVFWAAVFTWVVWFGGSGKKKNPR